jgi:hypothetical protein
VRSAAVAILVLAAAVLAVSCSHDGGGAASCPTGAETCACYGNMSCNRGLTCASNVCVNLSPTGGTSGSAGANGGTSGGAGGTSGGAGGSTSGAGGAAMGSGGKSGGSGGTSGGSGGTTGAGGTTGGAGSSGCNCSAPMECTTDGRCVDPNVIDDFADCNTTVNLIRGRNGGWYEAADVGINVSFAVGTPPTGYSDRQCGAWTTGGPTGNGTTTYALLSAYSGISVALEAQAVDFTIKMLNGGYFTKRLAKTTGLLTYNVDFSTLVPRSDSTLTVPNWAGVTDIQFTVIDPTVGYGFVIHGLTLY